MSTRPVRHFPFSRTVPGTSFDRRVPNAVEGFRTNRSVRRITYTPFVPSLSKHMGARNARTTSFAKLRTNGVAVFAPSAVRPDPLDLVRDMPVAGRIRNTTEAGFSLIEALVALAILAIATVGLIRTVETHIDSTRALEGRQAAMWVAENRLAELEAGIDGSDRADMLGRAWRIAVAERATGDPAIRRVRIDVYETPGRPNASPLASLDGFVDAERS
jgi:general secretion pathway protein I